LINFNLEEKIDCKDLCVSIEKYVTNYTKEHGTLKDCLLTIFINKVSHTIDLSKKEEIGKIEKIKE